MTEEKNPKEVVLVFGMGRRKTRSQVVKAELGESLDHFMRAATQTAVGVGASVGPRVESARQAASHGWGSTMAAVAPLAVAAADGARQAGRAAGGSRRRARNLKAMRKRESRMSRNRWPMLAGLLAAGTAVGAAGALVMRRRKQQQWEEYDPSQAIDSAREGIKSAVDSAEAKVSGAAESTRSATDKAADTAADKVAEKAEANRSKPPIPAEEAV